MARRKVVVAGMEKSKPFTKCDKFNDVSDKILVDKIKNRLDGLDSIESIQEVIEYSKKLISFKDAKLFKVGQIGVAKTPDNKFTCEIIDVEDEFLYVLDKDLDQVFKIFKSWFYVDSE